MSVQQFCLRWNNHQPNFISVCSSLLHNGTLVDVTLAAEGRQLQAHKIVLSACSSYFQTLFTTNPCQHPIVILKDVQYDDLKTMVDFMYYGEVNVSQEQLPHILKTAEMLKIKGLAEMPTDPANLTKSDNKSLNEGAELVGSHAQSSTSTASNPAGLGSSTSGSVNDSIWGGTEAQFQQQQQTQQQHQQHAQQHQQHHHHHHHQQQQQNTSSQSQTTQGHHQLRRTPSPLGAGTSPATRRKRLRKSSNNGSGERTNTDDQHNSLEATNPHSGISLSQMSFGTSTGATLNNVTGHSLHTNKLLKDSTNTDIEQPPHDSDLEDGHGHIHIQIKPEVDISGVNQSMPLDISGATTPSEHDAPNSQSSHSDFSSAQLTSTNFSSERVKSIISPLQSNLIQQQMGTKRNRVLTRQPRVKRDSDSFPSTKNNNNQLSSDSAATLDFDPFNTAGTSSTATDYSTTHHLLSVPQRIERHVSEPTPSTAPSSPHLLSVPHGTSFLIKQHSDPLLPSQHSTAHASTQIGSTNHFAQLHRQYSHPLSGSSSINYVIPAASLHHPHHIALPEAIYASSSPPPAGSSHYIVPQQATINVKNSNEATSLSMVTSIVPASNLAAKAASPPPTCGSPNSSSIKVHNSSQFTTFVNEDRRSDSPTIETVSSSEHKRPSGNFSKFRNSKSTSSLSHVDSRSNISQLNPVQPTSSNSFDQLPVLRVKNEELQRSVSSPQTQREIITLENPRSSHCPVIRPGPALGCNFCWNTIDGHGRILRRKTKYHCPECQTNLCIVPCFQEYHERLNSEVAATSISDPNIGSKSYVSGSATATADGRHYAKTESI